MIDAIANLIWAVFIAWLYCKEPYMGIFVLTYALFCQLDSIKRKQ